MENRKRQDTVHVVIDGEVADALNYIMGRVRSASPMAVPITRSQAVRGALLFAAYFLRKEQICEQAEAN